MKKQEKRNNIYVLKLLAIVLYVSVTCAAFSLTIQSLASTSSHRLMIAVHSSLPQDVRGKVSRVKLDCYLLIAGNFTAFQSEIIQCKHLQITQSFIL
jgi:hypothetical protein